MTLEEFRNKRGLTFEQLADLLGIGGANPARTVQRYATFERLPSRLMLRVIEAKTGGAVTYSDFPDQPDPRPMRSREPAPAPVSA